MQWYVTESSDENLESELNDLQEWEPTGPYRQHLKRRAQDLLVHYWNEATKTSHTPRKRQPPGNPVSSPRAISAWCSHSTITTAISRLVAASESSKTRRKFWGPLRKHQPALNATAAIAFTNYLTQHRL